MFGEIDGKELANQSFDLFKRSLEESYPPSSLSSSSLQAVSDYNKNYELAKKEAEVQNRINKLSSSGDSRLAFGKKIEENNPKLSWTTRNYNVGELYQELSDGSMYKKFETYTPGINNYENYARNQSVWDKAENGLIKFADTVGTGIIGGTAGMVYGIGNMIKEGSFSALYDNDFNNALDLHSEKMNVDYANYVSSEDKKGFMGKGVANLIFDDVFQGLAFTTGALLTEAIWATATGGVSLATVGSRLGVKIANVLGKAGRLTEKALDAGKYLDDVVRVAKIAKQEAVIAPAMATRNTLLGMKAGIYGGRVGEALNITRGVITSAGYEAGFEARAYMNEARRDFKEQFKKENGREPEAGELAEFEDKLKSTANGLFTYNLALVGASNLAQFGKLMKINLPKTGITEALNKSIFGVGTKVVDGAVETIKATRLQKGLQIGWSTFGKGALMEGAFEEGLQSVGKRTADYLIKSSYDKNFAKENYGLVESFTKSFGDVYSTKEGLNEVFTGMLVGALAGNMTGMYQTKGLNFDHEFTEQKKRNEEIEKEFGKNSNYTSKVAIENMVMANRVLASNKAEENAKRKGDLLGGQQARAFALHAQFQRGNALNFLEEQVGLLNNQIDLLDEATLAKNQGISLEQAKEAKASMKEELQTQYKNYKRINEFSNFIIGSKVRSGELEEITKKLNTKVSKEQGADILRQALTYELFMGENAYRHADEMLGAFHNELQNSFGDAQALKSISILDVIKKSTIKTQKDLFKTKVELTKTRQELKNSEKLWRELQGVVENASTPEERQTALANLNELTQRRNDLTQKEVELNKTWNALYDSAKLENPLGENKKEIISSEELDNLDVNIQSTLSSIEQLRNSNPEKAERLTVLLNEYEKSLGAWKKYSERTNQMIKMDLGRRSPLSQILGRKTTPNEDALEMIKALMDTHFEKDKAEVEITKNKIREVTEKSKDKDGVSMRPQEDTSNKQNLVEYIQNLIKNNPYLFEQIGGDFNQTLPTDEELIEYIELYSPVLNDPNFDNKEFTYNNNLQLYLFKKYLSEEEINRLVELNTKFANWQLLEGAVYDGVSIAELIQQQAVLNKEVAEKTTEGVLTEEDVEKLEGLEEGDRRFDILQTPQHVFIRQDKGDVIISHMTPNQLLQVQGQVEATLTKSGAKSSKKVSVNDVIEVEEGDVISYGNTNVRVLKGGKLAMKKDAFNLLFRKTKSGYSIVYLNGEPIKSEFTDVDKYSAQEIYNLKNGDELTVIIDLEDSYNDALINSNKPEQEVKDNLKISFYDANGNKVADLKANYGGEENEVFLALRERAFDLAYSNMGAKRIELGYVDVQTIFLGAPNTKLDESGKVREFDVVNPERILDYGTWDGTRANLRGATKEVRTDFLKGLDKSLPIVVLQEGGVKFAYPVTLKTQDREAGKEIMERGLPKAQLAIEINRQLKANGINSELFYISEDNNNMFQPDGKTSEELEIAIEQLNKLQDKVNYQKDWFDPKHSKEKLITEISVNLNVEDTMLLSPKIVIDYNTLVNAKNNIQTEEKISQEINDLFEARKELSKIERNIPTSVTENTFKFEGANFNYITDSEGNTYSMSISNKKFAKLIADYNSYSGEIKDQILSQIKKMATNRGKNFFDRYNNITKKITELENKINSNFLLKVEYDDIIQLQEQKKKESLKNKKRCRR